MTPDERRRAAAAALTICKIIADAIKELGSIPSGHLYARIQTHLTLEQYRQAVETLKGSGLVEEKNDVLIWKGGSQ
jgi:hypothetical protein